MSAVQITILPHSAAAPASQAPARVMARKLARFAFISYLLFTLFTTLFPFDFVFPRGRFWEQASQRFDWRLNPYDPGLDHLRALPGSDRVQNVLLFIPLGLTLAGVVRARRLRWLWPVVAALPLGAGISGSAELLQCFLGFRDPSFADVWCNTLGCMLGAAGFAFVGDKLFAHAASGLLRVSRFATPAALGAALGLYCALQLAAPLLVSDPADLGVWDTGMPLLVGNEATADRPWTGTVQNIVLSDRSATADEVRRLAEGEDAADIFGKSLVAHYRLAGPGPYPDLSKNQQPLVWMGSALPQIGPGEPVQVSADHWLSTKLAVAPAIYRIARTRELTLSVLCASPDSQQRGPARVVSISRDGWHRDVSILQEYPDLSVRLRTSMGELNGTRPEMLVRDVFADPEPRLITLTHKAGQIVVYIDGQERGRVEITPEAKLIWRLYPRGGWRIRIEKYGFRSYALIYRLLVFIPFSALLAALLRSLKIGRRRMDRLLLAAGAVTAMALAVELMMGLLSVGGFSPGNLTISLTIGLLSAGPMLWREPRPA